MTLLNSLLASGARYIPAREVRFSRARLIVIVALLLLALPTLVYPLGRDQGEFAVIGRGLLQGDAPYVDLWNPKPPAVFAVYAAAMAVFGQTPVAVRAIDLLIMPAMLLALARVGQRLFNRRVGILAAVLFGVFYFTETFWTLTQNDGIALLPMCLAIFCALRAAEGGQRYRAWALAAGALMGLVFWFKYPFALFLVPLLAGFFLARPAQSRAAPLTFVGLFALGLLTVLAGVVLWLVSVGAWDAFLESARVTSAYTALALTPESLGATVNLATILGFRWSHWGLLFIFAAFGLLSTRHYARTVNPEPSTEYRVPSTQDSEPRTRSAPAIILIWLLTTLVILIIQLRGYDYHWLPLLPPLALFGAAGLAWLLDRVAQAAGLNAEAARAIDYNIVFALFAVLAASTYPRALPYLTGQMDQVTYADQFVAGEFVAGESQRVADYLRQRVAPGDSLYIWGFRPEVYFLSDLNPPTRFIFHFPLVADWYPAAWRDENVEVLWAALPPYVLVLQVDHMPWVTGSEADSNTLLQRYTELNNWLMFNYERAAQIGNFFVWQRKPQPG